MRHRIDIEHLVAGSPNQNEYGEPSETWTVLLNDIWAAVEPLNGRELFAAQEHHAEVTTRIRIRYRDGVTSKMRVVFESRNYNIRYILDPEERHRELHLLCSTGVNDG